MTNLASTRPLTDVEKDFQREVEAIEKYFKRQKINTILKRVGVVTIIAATSAAVWKLDPINRALDKQGIELTED